MGLFGAVILAGGVAGLRGLPRGVGALVLAGGVALLGFGWLPAYGVLILMMLWRAGGSLEHDACDRRRRRMVQQDQALRDLGSGVYRGDRA